MSDAILSLSDVSKSYGSAAQTVTVLSEVSLALKAGETLALTGESGSGKSTLIHLSAGLDTADSGKITVDGVDIGRGTEAARAELRRDMVGLIFQQFNLVPSLTVRQNIGLQARLSGRHDPDFGAHLIDFLGLGGLEDRFPEQLSGGQQQRVAVARALAPKPPLVLADEPTGNLDEGTGDAVLDLLQQLVRDTDAALLFVTHSSRLAARMDRLAHLERGRLDVAKGA